MSNKMTKLILQLFIIATTLLLLSPSAVAASITDDLPASNITGEEEERILRNISFHKIANIPNGKTITSFDASEQWGLLLVSKEGYLFHMDFDGSIISVYQFNNVSAGPVGVAWDSSDICLFFTKSDIILKADCYGFEKEILRLNNQKYQTQKKWNSLAFREEKIIKTGKIELQKGAFLLDIYEHGKLVFVDGVTGYEKTVYDVSAAATAKTWTSIFIGMGVFLLTIMIIKDYNSNRGTGESPPSQ